MACVSGPKIANDGLTFYMDSSNTRRSWKGRPTTNLVGNNFFDGNGNFTIDENVSDVMPDGSIGVARLLNAQFVTDPNRTVSIGSYALDAGQTYTLSFYVMNIDCTGFSGNLYSPTLLRVIGSITYPTVPTDVWTRVTTTFTVPNEGPNPVTVSPQAFRDGGNGRFKLCWLQLEQNTFATPYVSDARSSTQALIDLSGNNNIITANTLTYYSNNTFFFNGSSSYANTSYDMSWNNTNSATICLIMKPSSLSTSSSFIGKTDYEWQILQLGQSIQFVYWNTSGGHTNGPIITINNFFTSTSQYVHLSLVWNHVDNNVYIYRNGILVNTSAWVDASINRNISAPINIGGNIYAWGYGSYWTGSIDGAKFYNRALSGNEISQDFEAIRGKYGI